MRAWLYCTLALALLSSGCAAEMRTPLTTADAFAQAVVDRSLAGGARWLRIRIHSDGTMTGRRGDSATLSGTWRFEDGYFCREAIVNGRNLGYDCQTVSIDGDKVVFWQNRGRGQQVTYFIR